VSFHRNVYDLLDLRPEVSPRAGRIIRAHERKHGPPPASVGEWYCVENVVPLTEGGMRGRSSLWYDYSNMDPPESLSRILRRAARLDDRPGGRLVRVMGETQLREARPTAGRRGANGLTRPSAAAAGRPFDRQRRRNGTRLP
jgi:hypothetical protein